jgi:DNA-binding PadR family transcriptional regulator
VGLTAVMDSRAAVELALLGLVAERPRLAVELIDAVKLLGGERFTPTASFIDGRLEHLLETGCLEREEGGERLCATRAGLAQLAQLLRLDVEPSSAILWAFCTTLKLSLLDLAGPDCRREAIASLLGAGRRRAGALETAQGSARGGSVVERCLALEQQREALKLRWLHDVTAAAEGIGASAG